MTEPLVIGHVVPQAGVNDPSQSHDSQARNAELGSAGDKLKNAANEAGENVKRGADAIK